MRVSQHSLIFPLLWLVSEAISFYILSRVYCYYLWEVYSDRSFYLYSLGALILADKGEFLAIGGEGLGLSVNLGGLGNAVQIVRYRNVKHKCLLFQDFVSSQYICLFTSISSFFSVSTFFASSFSCLRITCYLHHPRTEVLAKLEPVLLFKSIQD